METVTLNHDLLLQTKQASQQKANDSLFPGGLRFLLTNTYIFIFQSELGHKKILLTVYESATLL